MGGSLGYPIIGVQGPSAAGKSTLCARLARDLGGEVVRELAESPDWIDGAPPADPADEGELLENGRAFLAYECRRWRRALAVAEVQPAIFDTEWIGQLLWRVCDLQVTHPHFDRPRLVGEIIEWYRERVGDGDLACCDAIVLLDPDEAAVRRQRAADPARRRRNFERNLRVAALQRPYWQALRLLFVSRLTVAADGAALPALAVSPLPARVRQENALRALHIIEHRALAAG